MLLGTALILLLLGSAGPASAHAALRGADPGEGSVVKSAPRHVTLTFTESVALLDDSFRIYSPDNHRVPLDEPEHADGRSDTARIGLPDGLDDGTYTVAWRVVSADSHPASGAFTFSIGKPSPTAPMAPAAPAEHPITASLYDTGRYLAYIAAALLIGTVAFAALCRPPDTAPLRMLGVDQMGGGSARPGSGPRRTSAAGSSPRRCAVRRAGRGRRCRGGPGPAGARRWPAHEGVWRTTQRQSGAGAGALVP
ncbi:hypothetical protein SHIRM173S_00489 [Streptomyces hirsutus]